ncbi:MAG: MBOAT family protein [Bradyrhizobiaceae bacterium]|nr:MBOAT family protein [Bradyrhizobiaceae bacterium]
MLFYEPFFALFVAPAFYALYLAINNRAAAKKSALIVASVAFYTWGEPLFVPIVIVSTAVDYWLSQRMALSSSQTARRAFITVGILLNLGILVFYKYVGFLAENLNLLLGPLAGTQLPILQIALPIGVSFVVFEKISYLVDVYRGTTKPACTILDYSLFVFLFPKLLAGPILKYHEMERQFADPAKVGWTDFQEGFLRTARGMAKKILLADPLGAFADRVFAADATTLSSTDAAVGLVCFALQIYFDFSAYSDMAIGLARTLGFRLRENFNMPYISRSLTEFWRRWHISLATWIRDYLYIPLGGNRSGEYRTYINLWICFLASGIWHGASWNFVLWGAYNGLFLSLDRMFLLKFLDRIGNFGATVITLLIVTFGWAIFRTTSVEHLAAFTGALAGLSPRMVDVDMQADVPLTLAIGLFLCLLPATPLFAPLQRAYNESRLLQGLAALAILVLWVLACGRAFAVPFKPFIYFRF